MTVTPASVVAGSAASLAFAFTVDGKMKGDLALEIPRGWTAPQTADPGRPGYVSLRRLGCKKHTGIDSISGGGPWTIVVEMKCGEGRSFVISYDGVSTATRADTYLFRASTSTNGKHGRVLTPLAEASQPRVVVVAGRASRLAVAAPTAARAHEPFALAVTAEDRFGNRATTYTGAVGLSSSDPAAVLPPPASAAGGALAFARVTFRSPGTQTLTASDGTLTGTSAPVAVAAGEPLRVTSMAATGGAATATIGSAGGSVSVRAPDGTSYTLEVPEAALDAPVAITITPLARLGGLPLASTPLAALKLEPAGTEFRLPSLLRIVPPTAIPRSGLVGLGFSGPAEAVGLQPFTVAAGELRMLVGHFSGVAIAPATVAEAQTLVEQTDPALPAISAAEQRADEALVAAGFVDNSGVPEAVAAQIMTRWYTVGVQPALARASTGYEALQLGVREAARWLRQLQAMGASGNPALEPLAADLMRAIPDAYDETLRAYTMPRCDGRTDGRWQSWYELPERVAFEKYRIEQLLGIPDPDTLDGLLQRLRSRSCLLIDVTSVDVPGAIGPDDDVSEVTVNVNGVLVPSPTGMASRLVRSEDLGESFVLQGRAGAGETVATGGTRVLTVRLPHGREANVIPVVLELSLPHAVSAVARITKTIKRYHLETSGPTEPLPLGPGDRDVCARVLLGDDAVRGTSVSFALEGPGTLGTSSAVTGDDGKACVAYRLPEDPVARGTTATVTARATAGGKALRATFVLTPYWLDLDVSVDTGPLPIGPGERPVCVTVTDPRGPVAERAVTLALTGAGSLVASSVTTGADGRGCTTYRLAEQLVLPRETAELRATLTQRSFTETETRTLRPKWATVTIADGDTDVTGGDIALEDDLVQALTLVATDNAGPVAGARLQLDAGAARVTPAEVVTDAAGRATVTVDASGAGGDVFVTASYRVGSATVAPRVRLRPPAPSGQMTLRVTGGNWRVRGATATSDETLEGLIGAGTTAVSGSTLGTSMSCSITQVAPSSYTFSVTASVPSGERLDGGYRLFGGRATCAFNVELVFSGPGMLSRGDTASLAGSLPGSYGVSGIVFGLDVPRGSTTADQLIAGATTMRSSASVDVNSAASTLYVGQTNSVNGSATITFIPGPR